jgi:capsular exopolysaccharide synthesis family protein
MYGTALLIDADLRKPNISNMCGFKKDTKGLAEYLINGNNLEQFIMKTPIPEFYIIPSGKPPDNPAELISSEKMINLIREIKNRYQHFYIILDSPPLIPVVDSTILASLADSVIIVIKASSTPKELIEESINKIEDKKKIQGLILNECDSHVFKYYDTYYKYYKENE